ncbi:hypothetical protein D3C73_776900 [compost metagenome]
MLTFEEKLAIVNSFPELERKDVSLRRINFHYENSAFDKKIVVYHLHPNGNGYVYAGLLAGIAKDEKGFINIRDYSAEELRSLIQESIQSLSTLPAKTSAVHDSSETEIWSGPDNETLTVLFEDDLWYVYAGPLLESAFETYEEVKQYMKEEEFTRN